MTIHVCDHCGLVIKEKSMQMELSKIISFHGKEYFLCNNCLKERNKAIEKAETDFFNSCTADLDIDKKIDHVEIDGVITKTMDEVIDEAKKMLNEICGIDLSSPSEPRPNAPKIKYDKFVGCLSCAHCNNSHDASNVCENCKSQTGFMAYPTNYEMIYCSECVHWTEPFSINKSCKNCINIDPSSHVCNFLPYPKEKPSEAIKRTRKKKDK